MLTKARDYAEASNRHKRLSFTQITLPLVIKAIDTDNLNIYEETSQLSNVIKRLLGKIPAFFECKQTELENLSKLLTVLRLNYVSNF
jgi:hypothetical protein